MARRRRSRARTRPRLGGLLLLLLALGLTVVLHRMGILVHGPPAGVGGGSTYARSEWAHWLDEDGDCQDTRTEVLVATSQVPVRFADERHCKVTRGRWRCPYTGRIVTDPHDLDIDHLVPLSAAHVAGGDGWTGSKKAAFANALDDPDHLVAVLASANRSKGDKGPDRWLPSEPAARCDYVRAWTRIKSRWDLEVTGPERAAVDDALARCARGEMPAPP